MNNTNGTETNNTTQQTPENDTANKLKDIATDISQKIKENEAVANVTAKINASKYSKLIKIGVIAVAVFLVFSLFSAIFGDDSKVAEEAMTKEILTSMQNAIGYSDIEFESELISKNRSDDLYLFDTTLTYTRVGENHEEKTFYIVYTDGKSGTRVRSFSYEDNERDNIEEEALAVLKKGMKKPSLPN